MVENGGTEGNFSTNVNLRTETPFRIVPAAVFIYDCSRLFFMIVLLSVFLKPGTDYKIIRLPLIMFASPNALFPLMSFFLFVRFTASRAYIPLYITGKTLSMLCAAIWILISNKPAFNTQEILWVIFLSAADLGTIMGMVTVMPSGHGVETAEGGE